MSGTANPDRLHSALCLRLNGSVEAADADCVCGLAPGPQPAAELLEEDVDALDSAWSDASDWEDALWLWH